MKQHKRILLLVVTLVAHLANGQINICECCAYSSLKFKNDYEGFFTPNIIRNNKIGLLTIYTQGSNDSLKTKMERYRELKFAFDARGKVISRTEYNRNGKPHSIYEFDRDGAGKVLKETFFYLDSLERKVTEGGFSVSDVTDYTYDVKHRLIKSKERDINGRVISDSQSNFTKYEYDDKGRRIKETRQYYYGDNGPETSIYITSIKYDDKKYEGLSETFENKKLFLTSKTGYTNTWKVLTENQYDGQTNMVTETQYAYDKAGRLTRFETKAGALASECPDAGTYVDSYEYDNLGLVTQIVHRYGKNTCLMTFEYR